jgi:methylglutamate dehydrogenase subunit B
MLIKCPHCGQRPVEEFVFLGDAAPTRPKSNEPSSMEAWYEYVFVRDNPKGRIREYVHHAGGCRAWLVVNRDTVTHEIFSTMTARDWAKKRGKSK